VSIDVLRAPDPTCEYLDSALDDISNEADTPEIGVGSEVFLLLDGKAIGNYFDSPVSGLRGFWEF
jgi:hypothetical protein